MAEGSQLHHSVAIDEGPELYHAKANLDDRVKQLINNEKNATRKAARQDCGYWFRTFAVAECVQDPVCS